MKAKLKNMASSVFIETYGCQMNKYDSELIAGMLREHGYGITENIENADIILVNTCSVRDHAEQRVLGRIQVLRHWKNAPNKKLGRWPCRRMRSRARLRAAISPAHIVSASESFEYRTRAGISLANAARLRANS